MSLDLLTVKYYLPDSGLKVKLRAEVNSTRTG